MKRIVIMAAIIMAYAITPAPATAAAGGGRGFAGGGAGQAYEISVYNDGWYTAYVAMTFTYPGATRRYGSPSMRVYRGQTTVAYVSPRAIDVRGMVWGDTGVQVFVIINLPEVTPGRHCYRIGGFTWNPDWQAIGCG